MALKAHQIRMVQGDTLPKLRGTLSEDGVPVDLTGGSVKIHIRQEGVTLEKEAELIDAAAGQYIVHWAGTELVPGKHNYEIQVTLGDGGVLTFNRHSATDKLFELLVDAEVA